MLRNMPIAAEVVAVVARDVMMSNALAGSSADSAKQQARSVAHSVSQHRRPQLALARGADQGPRRITPSGESRSLAGQVILCAAQRNCGRGLQLADQRLSE